MSENAKTITFVAVAAAVLLGAWVSLPSLPVADPTDVRGKPLFPDFTDPLLANSMEIVEYDQSMATVRPFVVAQAKGRWSIPSHDNYPADAKDQVAQAATNLKGQKILDVAGDSVGDHATYGVVDPDPKTLRGGATGVGMRVAMKDAGGKTLVSLIVGKQVPGSKSDLRYVRKTGEDMVYVVELKTDKFSTKFEDWIEKNLLKMDSWDIKQVEVRDYAVDTMNSAIIQRGETLLDYNDTGEPRWKVLEDRQFEKGKWVARKLADDEEPNAAKLDEMRTALSDLKIVDVQPKPKGLSAELKAAEDFTKNREAVQSLASRGFYVAQLGGAIQLVSNQGEFRTRMKTGVEYILRFGDIALGSDTGGSNKKDDKADDKKDEKKEASKTTVNRYIFVTTEFNPDIIPKPELEPLPKEEKADDKKADAKAPEGKPGETKPADTKSADKKADDKKAAEKKPDEKPADAEKAKAERERIEKENKRKQDEYDEKVKAGKEKVKELNARFADWYFIISDETYQKIHLGRKDIVKKKEVKDDKEKKGDEHAGHDHGPSGAGDTPADFDKLKSSIPAAEKK